MKKTLIVAAAVLAAGCGGRTAKKTAPQAEPVVAQAGQDEELSIRGKESIVSPELEVVRFDYDKAELTLEGRESLKRNAEWLKAREEVQVAVEGHCDERGTTAYNLALGQRRAEQVRGFYKSLGIPVSRVATVSYGEERPVCKEDTEACHARNRRAVTSILGKALSGGNEPAAPTRERRSGLRAAFFFS